MCTYITEKATISGNGKGHSGWFELSHANIYYDHPVHAAMDHALMIDFVNEAKGPSARVAVELSPESADGLRKIFSQAAHADLSEKLPIIGSGKGPRGWFYLDLATMHTFESSKSSADRSLVIEFLNQKADNTDSLSVEINAQGAGDIAEKIKAALEAPL